MATTKTNEYQSTQYYFHQYYANVYYRLYLSIEDWISKNIFRNDTSRVFLASPDYAFRRRYELTDASKEDYSKVEASSLHFPFASYWPLNTGWIADDRFAANTAAQVYMGIYEGNTQYKSISGVLNIPIIFYFDREDDARLAYEILMFKEINPHYYTNTVAYGSNSLNIPVVLTIKDIVFNPIFKESDWLKQNRIFTITVNFSVRSYIIQTPNQPDYNLSVNSDNYLTDENGNVIIDENGNPVSYISGISDYYIVNNVLFSLGSYDWEYYSYLGADETSSPKDYIENPKVGVVYINSYNSYINGKNWYIWSAKKGFQKVSDFNYDETYSIEDFDSSKGFPESPKKKTIYRDTYSPNSGRPYIITAKWIWNPYTKEYESFDSNKLCPSTLGVYSKELDKDTKISIVGVDSTESSAIIKWVYYNFADDIKSVKIKLTLDSEYIDITNKYSEENNINNFLLDNLNPGSKYKYSLLFEFNDGRLEERIISFSTKKSSKSIEDNSSLIGVKW